MATTRQQTQQPPPNPEPAREPDAVYPALVPGQATGIEAITRGEIDIQIATAKRYPRSIALFTRDLETMALTSTGAAEACYYSLPRAGKAIEGPSIRFAEMIVACYKNLRVTAHVVGVDARAVTVTGYALDLEQNVGQAADVPRSILDRNGRRYKDDMVNVTILAALAIARRNAIFAIVPRALWEEVYQKVRKAARGDERTLATRRKAAWDYFVKDQKVPKALLLAKLEEAARERAAEDEPVKPKKGIEDIDLDDLELLTGLKNAVKDGDTTLAAEFPDMVPKKNGGDDPAKAEADRIAEELKNKPQGGAAGGGREPGTEG